MNNVKTTNFGDKHSPSQVLIDALDKAGTAKTVIVIILDEEDYIQTSWSDSTSLVRLGLLETAKYRTADLMMETE